MFETIQAGHKGLLTLLAALALAMLPACSTQQDVQPTLHLIDANQFGLQAGVPVEAIETVQPWWDAYGDAQLSQLINQALFGNPSMQVAQARLQRIVAQESYTRGGDKPAAQATTEVERQHFSKHGLYPPSVAGHALTIGTLQLESRWELDLFGLHRAELASAIGQTHATQADLQAARLMLSSQVARLYVQLARLQDQHALTQRTLAQRQEVLVLVRQRVDAGLDTAVELHQGEGALPDAQLQLEALDEQIMVSRHALATLSGQAPQALDGLLASLGKLQAAPTPAYVPVDLLGRRADVVAALWRAQAAGHQVDAARAMFYPNVDLTSYAGFNAIGLDQLLKASSLQWGLVPAIHLPLFDADRRRANLQGKVAEQDAALANYNQTVLQAVQEVADQMGSTQSLARQRVAQQAAQQSAEAAYTLVKARYGAGLGNYLLVLSAESTVLAQRRLGVDLQARTLDTQFNLIRTLGGSLQAAAPTGDRS